MLFGIFGRVVPASSWDNMQTDLHQAFLSDVGESKEAVKLTKPIGLVFARPASPLAKEEILPHLGYLNQRSKEFMYFYFAGYSKKPHPDFSTPDRIQIFDGWFYSDKSFDQFRDAVESKTKWVYSGGVDLILCAARFERSEPGWDRYLGPNFGRVSVDFSSAISMNLETLKRDGSLPAVVSLFENASRYAERRNSNNLAAAVSGEAGGRLILSGLIELAIFGLPEPLRNKAREAFLFATRDISKSPKRSWLPRVFARFNSDLRTRSITQPRLTPESEVRKHD